jgi:hypothetical protein
MPSSSLSKPLSFYPYPSLSLLPPPFLHSHLNPPQNSQPIPLPLLVSVIISINKPQPIPIRNTQFLSFLHLS